MTRSEAITELYALFDAPHNADINLTGLNRLLDELTEFPPAQQEPVAHQFQTKDGKWRSFIGQPHYESTLEGGHFPIRALYTTPQPAQRTFVGLTNEEVYTLGFELTIGGVHMMKAYKAIEAKLKEKNNG